MAYHEAVVLLLVPCLDVVLVVLEPWPAGWEDMKMQIVRQRTVRL